MKIILSSGLDALGIPYTEEMLTQFELYYALLVETNKVMNLTAITEKSEVAQKHFLDSAALLAAYKLPKGAKVIDIGTGAGFPGMVLKILRPDLDITLLDALAKRIRFLETVAENLKLCDKLTLTHSRAEDLARDDKYRERYALAVSRAVANLNTLSEYCLPFVKIGGKMAAYKGPGAEEELGAAANAIEILGGKMAGIVPVSVSGTDLAHNIVFVDKVLSTPTKYPRSGNKPAAKPL